ncbi:MAG: amino acid adenylation domain-containing protein [Thermoanaerobaculia bacterium]
MAALTPEQRRLLELKLKERRPKAVQQAIPRPQGRRKFPLSFAQQRLWFLYQLDPEGSAYNLPLVLRLSGVLDVAALFAGLRHLVARHEILRTTFRSATPEDPPGTDVVQEIHDDLGFAPSLLDLRALRGRRREAQIRQLVRAETRRPFDLTRGPLLRATLLWLAPGEHLLIVVQHHIVSDGRSLEILVGEIAALYDALLSGGTAALPELPIRYADFAVWQRQRMTGEELENQLAYWKRQLADAPAALELPFDRPRSKASTFRGARHDFALSADLRATLRSLARDQGVTLFMLLLAAFQVLLHRLTGQSDVVVGSPVANRTRDEIRDLIGFFVNTLVLRSDLSQQCRDPSFRQLLDRARETVLAAQSHQDLPFERLVEELRPERQIDRTPLFQVMFSVLRSMLGRFQLRGLDVRQEPVTADAMFDLTVELLEDDGGFRGSVLYNRDLFDATTVARLARHFETLLRRLAADPEAKISEMPLIGAAERHQVLAELNDTLVELPPAASIVELFEAQVRRGPDAVAVVLPAPDPAATARHVTYRDLDRRADRLARELRILGVGPEVLVGTFLDRSLDMVVATLAILKAGGAYLPLDPSYPRDRLAFMMRDTETPVVLTREPLAERLPGPIPGVRVIRLDAERPDAGGLGAVDSPSPVGRDHLAYVMYTSGSTGRPKGVAVTHRSVVRLVQETWFADFSPRQIFLQLAPSSFDAATLEIWGPLLNGGRLVVAVPGKLSLDELGALIERHRVTTLWLTAGLFHQMVESQQRRLRSLRQLLAGGDVLSPARVRDTLEALPCTVINGYGPTENTTFSTCHPMTDPPQVGATVAIGRPISNSRAYVLDRRLRPVPLGVPGQLCVAGAGLARGYLNRPALTAEKLVPDPVGGVAGGRVYLTGDRARFLADGTIEFQGRFDHQVKIRGFRIEPGEIEAALTARPEIEAACVVMCEIAPDDRRLVAYVVATAVDAAEVRDRLRGQLPDYMVPAAIVFLDTLPLNPNGKVDRRALPEPEWGDEGGVYRAPQNPTEELVAGVWSEVLGVERIGRTDNFFDLGGHSLLATQVISRLRQIFEIELPLRELFAAPSLAALAEKVTSARTPAPPAPPLVSRAHAAPESLPLSFAQERLWFLDQLAPGTATYNIPAVVRLDGGLDVAALKAALEVVVARHQALRTTFADVDGRPAQTIAPAASASLPVVDLSGLPPAAARAVVDELASEEARRPFDLAAGPLLRTVLLRLADDRHVALVTMHHIISDGWSIGVLLRELGALYTAAVSGEEPALPALPIQTADYALWQRRWLTGEVLDRQLTYWRQQLADLPMLELPTDRPRPALSARRRGATIEVALPADLSRQLAELGRRRGATLFMTLLAGFSALLGRTTGQSDVAVGSPIANRNRVETENLLGFFVNTLVLRVDLGGDRTPSFGELLDRVRTITLDAGDHQDVPFEKVVAEMEPERNLSATPLFQVVLALQNTPLEAMAAPGLELTPLPVATGTAKFDLTLVLQESASGLSGSLEYDRDLFDVTTVERLWRRFETLLRGAVEEPEARISELSLLSPAERQQVLMELNDTRSDYPRTSSVAELFEAQAECDPEAVAVVLAASDPGSGAAREVTYGELDRRADRLARELRRRGVGPEVLVGMCLERSLEMVVATLAILKADGAYLPLDPAYPRERLAFMLADTRAPVVLTQERLESALPLPMAGVETMRLDGDGSPIVGENADGEDVEHPRNAAGPDRLAYVMYTSGSTGRPKGVAVTHRSVVRLVRGTRFADFSPAQTFLQLAPTSFDAATLEIWGPLLNGGRLVVAPPHQLALEELGAVIERYRVTTLWLTSGLFHQMAESQLDRLRPVRQLLAGGDVLSPPLVRKALEKLPGTLINGYGPTENTTFSTCHPMTDPAQVGSTVAIGRPISSSQAYVLDRQLRPLPLAVPGQLCVAGDGLARGYLHRPALTAERFVPDPVSGHRGSRLYLTGDRARFLSDGTIEFQGRFDHQVKIRGFRIEPGEIETLLSEQPEVEAACVVVREPAPGDQRLVGYVVGPDRGRQAAVASTLRERLRAKLPDYMVPAAIVVLDALPLNPNGKVDRAALPAPDWGGKTADYVAPRTATEELVAGVWSEVLGAADAGGERVGADDDFFDLGGHSLLATQAISRLREQTGVRIPLSLMFESPTVAALAAAVEEARGPADRSQDGGAPPPIEPRPHDGAMALSFAQERLWILDQFEPANPAYNMPFALRLRGRLNAPALERCLGELVRHHEGLRTTFHSVDGRPVQRIAPPPEHPPRLPQVDFRGLGDSRRRQQLERLTREESLRPFDLRRGPLMRVILVRLAADQDVLAFNIHHIISDGWSLGILTRELGALYEAFSREDRQAPSDSPLPDLAVQYADYARWQRQWLSGEVLERQLAYWREQLWDLPPGLELPIDRPRPAVRSFRGDRDDLVLPPQLSRQLEALSRELDATLFMVLLAAFKVLLGRLAGETDVAIGAPVAGRNHSQIEDLVGIFLNSLVLRTDLAGNPPFRELVDRVREVALAAYAHQDLPFEKLLDELQPERDLSRTPLFQVFFNMVNLPFGPMELTGLSVEPLALPEMPSKFDLTIYATQERGRIRFELVYNADLFSAARIAELLRQYRLVLEQVAAEPATPIAELSLRTREAEAKLPDPRAALDTTWEGAVHELVARRAAARPEHPAVIDPAGEWTYRELEEQSNRLAHCLLDAGVERQQLVAIFAHRSATLLWAVLGVLKAGAAFAFLDPIYPAPHLIAAVRRARPRAWLQLRDAGPPAAELEAFLETMPDLFRLELPPWQRCGADDGGPLADFPATPPEVRVGPDDRASLSFTSGSTGVPKGIEGRHGPLTHFLPWQSQRFGLDGSDRYSLLSGLAHDPLQRDLFTPLCLGATVCIPDPQEIFAAGYLAAWMRRYRITVAHLTPAMAQVLTEVPSGPLFEPVESLRYAFLTGDVLTWRDVERLRKLAPGVECVNFYGSTETQRAVGYYPAPAARGGAAKQILPLGSGMQDVQLVVVNAAGRPAGVGELGEVWVRSPHLARGYLRDEELTRDRFRSNPWSDTEGDRVYLTGDLGRYLPDGLVAFAGRADHQVKIRGFRVELGEIQAQLTRLPGVREAVLLAASDAGTRDRQLTACIVTEDGEAGTGARAAAFSVRLREALRHRLPAYMVPARFALLESIPLTPNGKIDRAALGRAVSERLAADRYRMAASDQETPVATESPQTEMEQTISGILQSVLEIDRVGVDDNFFDLGANSLLLVQVHSRLQEMLGREIHAVEIFNHPTVATLAAYLSGSGNGSSPAAPVEDRSEQLKTGRDRLRRRRRRRQASR